MKLIFIVVFSICFHCSSAYYVKNYDGYQVIRTQPILNELIPALVELRKNINYIFMSDPIPETSLHIMTSAKYVNILIDSLNLLRLNPEVIVPDVGVHILREREQIENQGKATFENYMTFSEIEEHMNRIIVSHPDSATEFNLGTTYEGRSIKGLSLKLNPIGNRRIFVECGIHAREWLGPTVCTNLIDEIYATRSEYPVTWDILPIANPDGYEYTWSFDRYWNKNRAPTSNPSCLGTDINRNFNIHWNNDSYEYVCSDIYPGNQSFSELESTAIKNYLNDYKNQIILYISVQSYGTTITYPPGYEDIPPVNAGELLLAGNSAAEAIKAVQDTEYAVSQTYTSMTYATFGASDDYAWNVTGVPFVYRIKLPGDDFIYESVNIQKVVDETVPGIFALAEFAVEATAPTTPTPTTTIPPQL